MSSISVQQYLDILGIVSRPLDHLQRLTNTCRLELWVHEHRAQWNHNDWLDLLEALKKCGYWPLNTDELGAELEWLKEKVWPEGKRIQIFKV